MVADGSSSIQSYIDELVNKIDAMSSAHRTRLIKKWAKSEHFPSPKFMAAMFSSMMIFGQLYPYDGELEAYNDSEHIAKKQKQEWFWYNSIMHTSAVNAPKGFPRHMPPHGDDKWPTDSE
jgi:hypothetical protein